MSGVERLEYDIVVLGGGFAGVYCAREAERALGRGAATRVALIAEENYMVFQPMLAEVVGGSISPRHVVNPLRMLCPRSDVLKGRVESIDRPARTLTLLAGPQVGRVEVRYRELVVALGATIDLRRIPGMPEHAFLIQNVGDAMLLRSTIIARLEEASIERRPEVRERLLTFVVVGGGYSGVETAGQILDLFRGVDRHYARIALHELRVVLVHSGDRLLPTLTPRLGEYCARVMSDRGIDLRLARRVVSMTANQVRLDDGTSLSTATVVSTVGNAPHPLVLDLIERNGLAAERGRIVVDDRLRVPGHEGLWAAGDCAAVPAADQPGAWCPQTAQFAYRQGRLLGRNLAAAARGRPLAPFRFKGLGELATIGHRAAVASVAGLNFSGFLAWWMWRTVYLQKLPRFDRKVRVVIDWTLDLFFPRDINLLSPRYSTSLKEIHLEAGDVLFTAGEPAFSLYVVRSGRIDLHDATGVVSSHPPGDYFGERALLGDRVWRFDARAAEASRLVSIPEAVFRQLVGSGGSLGRLFEKSAHRYQSREVIDAMAGRLPDHVLRSPVRAIMRRELITLRPGATVREAMAVVRDMPHSSYPVVGDDGTFLGMLRRDDFQDRLKRVETTAATPLSSLALVRIPAATADTPVGEIVELLVRSGANKVVILDADRRLEGIVTVMDLAAAAAGAPTS